MKYIKVFKRVWDESIGQPSLIFIDRSMYLCPMYPWWIMYTRVVQLINGQSTTLNYVVRARYNKNFLILQCVVVYLIMYKFTLVRFFSSWLRLKLTMF